MSTPASMRAAREIIDLLAGAPTPPEIVAAVIDRHLQTHAFCEAARQFESWEIVHGSTLPSPACLQTIKGQFGNALKQARANVEAP